jgi:hypothetical protein
MQDKITNRSRGFGFIIFKDSKSIQTVLKIPHIVDNKLVECKAAVPKEQLHPQDFTTINSTIDMNLKGQGSNLGLIPQLNRHYSSNTSASSTPNLTQEEECVPNTQKKKIFVGGLPIKISESKKKY